jgi:hypothetical protein
MYLSSCLCFWSSWCRSLTVYWYKVATWVIKWRSHLCNETRERIQMFRNRLRENSRNSGKRDIIIQKYYFGPETFWPRCYRSHPTFVQFPGNLETVFFTKQRLRVNSRNSGRRDVVIQRFCFGPDIQDHGAFISQKLCAPTITFWPRCYNSQPTTVQFPANLETVFFTKQRLRINSRNSGRRVVVIQKFCFGPEILEGSGKSVHSRRLA